MSHAHRARRRAPLILASCALALAALVLLAYASSAGAAEPTGYGELARFGELGSFEGHLAPETLRTLAIGVDPTDNSVYLLDEPNEPKEGSSEKETRVLRLQKYTANGAGGYSLNASTEFSESVQAGPLAEPTIEGLAVDPSLKRVYLLSVEARKKSLAQAADRRLGEGLLVASTIYAFSTVESGSSLVEAPGTKPGAILVGPTELQAQSATPGQALLEPHGITVDPATNELIILAHEDRASAKEDSLKSAEDHYVLQRISSSGALGARYVDTTNKLKEEQEGAVRFPTPNSPIVATSEGKEHLYVDFPEGLAEIPLEFKSATPPKLVPIPTEGIEKGISPLSGGGALSAAPEGTIFGANLSGIVNEEPGGAERSGLLALSPAATEIGWTGGGQLHEAEPKYQCVISPGTFSSLPIVAAGSGGKVFALAPEFLLREEEGEPEIVEIENPVGSGEIEIIETPTYLPLAGPFFPPIVEFGPGGAGCPQASATSPVAKVNQIEVKGEEAVKPGSEVEFSSQVHQADALQTEWEFGDGSKETTGPVAGKPQSTIGKHKYTTEGTFTVTERIFVDDLAAAGQAVYTAGHLMTPTITLTRTIAVGPHPPKAVFTEPGPVAIGQPATFASHSSDPNGAEGLPLTYAWSFGDGGSASEESVTHAYAAAGTYTVTLTVTDKLGLKSTATQAFSVTSPSTPPPTTTVSPPPPPVSTTPPPPPGHGGVLSYSVSIAGSALSVSSSNGAFSLKVDCAGQSSCHGTAVLRTASAVSAGAHKHKAVLTLASGSFALAGGQTTALHLRLSSKARSLLARMHTIRAKVTISARDTAGVAHTTTQLLTLKLAKPTKKKHH